MRLTADIETLPTNDQAFIDAVAETITAPGQYKKPESIEAWMAENKESAVKEIVSKTSFDGLYGRIACIAWANGDAEIFSSLATDSEGDAIQRFYDGIAQQTTSICGHNIHGFDLPFLKHRSIILGIKPPPFMMRAMRAKAWGDEIDDTMLMWSPERDKRVSMDKLCKVFGIAGKGDFDGSMVADTWPTDPQKVIDYCIDDVSRTRKIYNRLTFEGA